MREVVTAEEFVALLPTLHPSSGDTLEALESAVSAVTGEPYRITELLVVRDLDEYISLIGPHNNENAPDLSN